MCPDRIRSSSIERARCLTCQYGSESRLFDTAGVLLVSGSRSVHWLLDFCSFEMKERKQNEWKDLRLVFKPGLNEHEDGQEFGADILQLPRTRASGEDDDS